MGGPASGRRSTSSTLGYPALHHRRCQGKAATDFQWSRPEPGCSGNASPRDARAINHRGAAYPGRAQESLGGRRGPTGRKLRLSKAGVPLGTSRCDFPIHAGSLGLGLSPGRRRTPLRPTPGLGLRLSPEGRRTPLCPTLGLGLSPGISRWSTPRPTRGLGLDLDLGRQT
jgi:hypothetical protein